MSARPVANQSELPQEAAGLRLPPLPVFRNRVFSVVLWPDRLVRSQERCGGPPANRIGVPFRCIQATGPFVRPQSGARTCRLGTKH